MIFKTWYGQDISLSFTTWRERVAVLSHRCISTGRLIRPLTTAMRGKRVIADEGSLIEVSETYWMLSKDFTFNKLKGII